ncbi:phosphoribosylformylglycinamidine cyclo-ligase [Acidianus sulfidivorans JP7]|uniref:Phosphoribosylformylglycinamidine cyclo-ligase n=1 Tax=Acidianus sulfidivorans JP7 TaxID=619593 RepID=A0A2U9INL6_9CREN|nr:phosphoribosylformylglycinamidine cyclo-ligase [Acidianus sulfidivorans]AWR97554.1 phosphoribosylformylglycinamidine cyclo-ligase [Acidianus sulfidivorans JP7]
MVSEYSKSGVDLNKLKDYHSLISNAISKTYKNTLLGAGHYSGVININGLKIAMHTDGVGTKSILALKTGIIEPIGIDCIAMNVNDLISIGAKPLAIVDYLAMGKPMDDVVDKVMKGLVKGAEESNTEIIGGETAIMPDVVNGFDLSCTAIGTVDKIKDGRDVKPGDVILGLRSNGIHDNGYSLVRKLIDEGKLSLDTWKDELMKPTKIYVKPILEALDKIKAAAHITGGSFSKLRRITNYKIELRLPEPQEIFKELEKCGVSHEEMYKVFNMGIGMVIFTSPEYKDEVIKIIQKYIDIYEIGKVSEGSGISIFTYKNVILHI